jgi:uncharacterized RDD family membrane protein YckC
MQVADEPHFPEKKIKYAGFWVRFVAALIDGAILFVAMWFMARWLKTGLVGDVTDLVAGWLYYSLQESGYQMATIGKKVLDLKVTNLDGGRISFVQASVRTFMKYLSAFILFIGFLMMLWDEKNRTLQDLIAGTLVVEEPLPAS